MQPVRLICQLKSQIEFAKTTQSVAKPARVDGHKTRVFLETTPPVSERNRRTWGADEQVTDFYVKDCIHHRSIEGRGSQAPPSGGQDPGHMGEEPVPLKVRHADSSACSYVYIYVMYGRVLF